MGGPLTDQTLVPRNRGAPKDPSPKTKVINQEPPGRLASEELV